MAGQLGVAVSNKDCGPNEFEDIPAERATNALKIPSIRQSLFNRPEIAGFGCRYISEISRIKGQFRSIENNGYPQQRHFFSNARPGVQKDIRLISQIIHRDVVIRPVHGNIGGNVCKSFLKLQGVVRHHTFTLIWKFSRMNTQD